VDVFAHSSSVDILGVPLRAARGWIAIALVLTAITIDALRPADSTRHWYLAASIVTLGSIGSLLLHEIAHVLAARAVGGSVSAIEPAMFGALSDDAYLPRSPQSEAWVAAAGPLASLLLALGCAAIWRWAFPDESLAAGAAGFLALFNLILFAGNAMPGFPLDGGRIFRAFVWYLTDDLITGTKIAAAYGQAIAVVAFVMGVVLLAVGDTISVWGAWGLIAVWSINRAGREGFIRTVWRETSRGLTIDDVGLGNTRRIDADRSIDDAIDDILQNIGDGPILVREGDIVIGVVTLDQIRQVPRAIWPERTVRDVALPIGSLPRLQYDDQLVDLAERFEQTGTQLLVVETRGKITGILERDPAIRRARARVRSIRLEQQRKNKKK
jgi:Zn-dependent protease